MEAPVTYVPNFVPDPDTCFTRLNTELEWERRGDAPRCEYYSNDFPNPYVYGKGDYARTYHPRPYHEVVVAIRKKLEEYTGFKFEVCFLNKYLGPKDQLGWHADDSPEMDDARPIVTVSLGVEREIWFRSKPHPTLRGQSDEVVIYDQDPATMRLIPSIEKLKLGHGSMALMAPGMQDTHQHRIPKASFQCGERISLTFRGYVSV